MQTSAGGVKVGQIHPGKQTKTEGKNSFFFFLQSHILFYYLSYSLNLFTNHLKRSFDLAALC